ncbi:MAG: ORF6N domain-containing protein [Burkholderiales bacterium]
MVTNPSVEPLIRNVRGHKVMLDADLARLYGVPTRVLNQAVKHNDDRFPEDFRFRLTAAEFADLRSQFATSNLKGTGVKEVPLNRSQTATGS